MVLDYNYFTYWFQESYFNDFRVLYLNFILVILTFCLTVVYPLKYGEQKGLDTLVAHTLDRA